jgi:hypothetical protein
MSKDTPDQRAGNSRRGWSDDELTELGDLLMCEISIQEIARLLGRDHDDVREKVLDEIRQACGFQE